MDLETIETEPEFDWVMVRKAKGGSVEYVAVPAEDLLDLHLVAGTSLGGFNAIEPITDLACDDGERSQVEECNETRQLPAGAGAETPAGKDAIGTQIRRKRGRRRLPRSIGRFPFSVTADRYLDALKSHRAEVTIRQLRWDLNSIKEDVRSLQEMGKVSTENPSKLTLDDIAALIGYWRERPRRGPGRTQGKLDPTSQNHLFRALKGLLEFCGNGAITQLKTRPYVQVPKPIEKPIRTLSESDLERLRVAADSMDGWHGAVARFLAAFCPETGLGPKEVRLQEVECVDLANRLVLVCHPKGEGKYATPHAEYSPIGEAAVQPLLDFLAEREAFLNGEKHPALIPFRHADGALDYWSAAMLGKVKAKLEKASGVKFQIRTFRATFGQRALDDGAGIESVSRSLRHRGTKTTEKYYARVRPDKALDEVRRALAHVSRVSAKPVD